MSTFSDLMKMVLEIIGAMVICFLVLLFILLTISIFVWFSEKWAKFYDRFVVILLKIIQLKALRTNIMIKSLKNKL